MRIWLQSIAVLVSIDTSFAVREFSLSPHVASRRTTLENANNGTQVLGQNNSSTDEINFHCMGSSYGWNLRVTSCLDALFQIEPRRDLETFGNRYRGDFDVPLPSRTLSGEDIALLRLLSS